MNKELKARVFMNGGFFIFIFWNIWVLILIKSSCSEGLVYTHIGVDIFIEVLLTYLLAKLGV